MKRYDVYARLAPGVVARTWELVKNRLLIDQDAAGEVLGVEVLDATRVEIGGAPMEKVYRKAVSVKHKKKRGAK